MTSYRVFVKTAVTGRLRSRGVSRLITGHRVRPVVTPCDPGRNVCDELVKRKVCPYCLQEFLSSRFHPDQIVCSALDCQRRRRTDYHRKRLEEDTAYRDQCDFSKSVWKEKNPNYQKLHRAAARKARDARSAACARIDGLIGLLRQSKKNPNISVKEFGRPGVGLWISLPSAKGEENTFAPPKVIVIEGVLGNHK